MRSFTCLVQSYSLVLELLHSDLASEDELFRKYYFLILLKKVLAPPVFLSRNLMIEYKRCL